MKKYLLAFSLILILSFSMKVHAQSGTADGTTPPADPAPTPTDPVSSGTATGGTPAPSSAATIPSTQTTPTRPKTRPSILQIVPTTTPKPRRNFPSYPPISTADNTVRTTLIGSLLAIAASILAFFGFNLQQKKEQDKKEDKKCLNIKKLMDDKLSELTDLRGQLTDHTKGKAIEALKDITSGTEAGEIIMLAEKANKEYDRLKELYEKCITSIGLPKTTLLFLHKPDEKLVLLGMKKRDLGIDKWNGIGGKLEGSESEIEAVIREAQEEIGVKIKPEYLTKVATLDFKHRDKAAWNQQSHVFIAQNWEGEPAETDEMSPKWHSTESLPYDKMWIDDPHWLPLVLEGKKLEASFTFDKEGTEIFDMKVDHKHANN